MYQQNPSITGEVFKDINIVFWQLKCKTSGISQIFVRFCNQKMLLMEQETPWYLKCL